MATAASIAETLFNDLMADALPQVVPLVENFMTSMAANPSAINLATQLTILQSSLLGVQPTILSAWVKQVNALVNAQEAAYLAPATSAAA